MSQHDLSRRLFLQRTAMVGAVTVGAGYLAACGGSGGSTEGGGETAALDCTDTSALSEDQNLTRESLGYVDASTDPAKNCTNCQQFQAPAAEGSCGTCLVVPGSINPDGNCTAWVEKVS